MCQVETDGSRGRADVYQGDPALELVVTCLVEEVAYGYDTRSFSCKVDGKPGSRTSKNPDHGI